MTIHTHTHTHTFLSFFLPSLSVFQIWVMGNRRGEEKREWAVEERQRERESKKV